MVLRTYELYMASADDITRLYRLSIGQEAFTALQISLKGDWGNDDPEADFLLLR
ncbi:hypothetical protein ALP93_200099 [Pseudomonas syringae pv. helianthi]|nr:hypothetical protein ALP93_200099 [Pseudomonas syringae pv. helianthi]